jgi:hypothetical protein
VKPLPREIVISGETVELVPLVVDRIDSAPFGSEQVAPELEIVRRIRKDHVDTFVGKTRHLRDAVPLEDRIQRKRPHVRAAGADSSLAL